MRTPKGWTPPPDAVIGPFTRLTPAKASERPCRMNKTEARYAAILEARKIAGEIREWHFEAVTLRLGDDCRYTPDFLVVLADGTLEFHETKGFWRDDAKVKVRVAASLFPFRFIAMRLVKGTWHTEEF